MVRSNNQRSKKRKNNSYEKKGDKIYFTGVVSDTLPGVKFMVKIQRGETMEPLLIECMTRTILKVKRVKILKGDSVTVEIDPSDLTKGVIVERNLNYNN